MAFTIRNAKDTVSFAESRQNSDSYLLEEVKERLSLMRQATRFESVVSMDVLSLFDPEGNEFSLFSSAD